jgi:MFS family permease
MSILYYFFGVILLIAGRKLYWFFCAVAGMVVGIYLAGVVLDAESMGWQIAFAAIGAILGAILAVGLQKLAIGIVGFIAGGYGATFLWQTIGLPEGRIELLPFILGGILAAILVAVAFEYGLIALTSWAGATLISRELELTSWVGAAVFFGLIVAGVVIQAVSLVSDRKKERAKKAPAKPAPPVNP